MLFAIRILRTAVSLPARPPKRARGRCGSPTLLRDEVYSYRGPGDQRAPPHEVTIRDESWTDSSFIMDLVSNDPRTSRPERRLMTKRLLAVGCAVIVPFVVLRSGTDGEPATGAAAPSAAAQPPSAPAPSSPQRALLDRYCVGCHSQRARAAGQDSARKLTLDDLDPARVSRACRTNGNSWCGSFARA